jgi:general secretion pathway protein D
VRFRALCVLLCLTAAQLSGDDAAVVYRQAQQAEKKGDVVRAYLLYSQAAAMDPENRKYWGRSLGLRTKAVMQAAEDRKKAEVDHPGAAAAEAAALAQSAGGNENAGGAPAQASGTPASADSAEGPPRATAEMAAAAAPEAGGGTAAPDPPVATSVGQAPGQPASAEAKPALEPIADAITDRDLDEARKMLPPPELQPKEGRQSFDLRGNSRDLFEKVAAAYGLQVIFDADFVPRPDIHFRVDDVNFREALRAIELATNSFAVPISNRMVMVAIDSEVKRRQIEPTVALVMSIPEPVSVQDAQEVARTVQSAMEIQRFMLDTTRRLVVVRDRLSKVRPAQHLLEQLLYHRPQVQIEVEFIDVSHKRSKDFGVDLPNAINLVRVIDPTSVAPHIGGFSLIPYIPTNFTRIITFGGGATLMGFALTGLQGVATFSDTEVANLMRTQLLAVDGQPVTMHIGDKYPIATNFYNSSFSGGFSLPPQINFEDLGLTLKIIPKINSEEEVTLDVEAEFKVLGGTSVSGIPIIQNRKFKSAVRLRQGEFAAVAGLVSSDEARTLAGIAGLAAVPLLGALTSHHTISKNRSEAMIVLNPHIIAFPPGAAETPSFWVGTESRLLIPMK